MALSRFKTPLAGVAVPIASLRSRKNLGVGEFPDLIPLGRWCQNVGLSIIQILPVNDTGFEPSPYSALSAFALHPLYARLQDFPEAQNPSIKMQIKVFKESLANNSSLDNAKILSEKFRLFFAMWPLVSRLTRKEAAIWAKQNPWVQSYALFSLIRRKNNYRNRSNWPQYSNPSPSNLKKLWRKQRKEADFYIWLQFRLEQQFVTVVRALKGMGVALKGDIPILVNEDSADVWAGRENFNLDLRTGSPPDEGFPEGQNWGFPTYNWDYLQSRNYQWWRDRLKQASKFYDAYRIDHVLGFFRIWAIPERMNSAKCGYFVPSCFIKCSDFQNLGWNNERIVSLSFPHFSDEELKKNFGDEALAVQQFLEPVRNKNLWREPVDGPTEQDIQESYLSAASKEKLIVCLRDRTLICVGNNEWTPSYNYTETQAWKNLTPHEQDQLNSLISKLGEKSEALWAENGQELLSMMSENKTMLVCAEDLGLAPRSLPGILERLGILRLKVLRWSRDGSREGQPYTPPEDYPPLSVATTSVHDSTTLRGWLAEEGKEDWGLREWLKIPPDTDLSGISGCKSVLATLNSSSSLLAIHPLQDWLALDPECVSVDPESERINRPGTVQASNWSWKMKIFVEDLDLQQDLNSTIKTLSQRQNIGKNHD